MTTAVVMLGTGDRQRGCRALLSSLEQFNSLPDAVDRLLLCDFDAPPVDFATSVPITYDYSDLSSDDEFKKLFMFLLPYNHVIYLASGLTCTGDVSVLWSESIKQHLLYARHLPDGSLDDSVMVFNHDRQLGFHDALLYLTRMHLFDGYGDTSRAVLHGYFCHTKKKVGELPPGLNFK